ncbi:PAS domain-containing protein [Legionella sp. km772]|uniref:PAS domain-containing protein n=1 Tax=Legionella sp. km772 TaxID=2498111 RepID=UPI000F8E1A52|nr:PAS domain-containing protein [Legionella sp. km772]RUR12703.1 PAS domain-containing protein [Legionella sp. km772]
MVERVDYQALMRAAPDLYLILSPDLKILDASDAYLKATMVKREAVIGRYVFDVFPNNPHDPGSADTQGNFLRSAQIILKYKTSHLMPIQRYDMRRPDGEFEARYWSPLTFPIFDVANNVKYLLHRAEDVTELDKLLMLRT